MMQSGTQNPKTWEGEGETQKLLPDYNTKYKPTGWDIGC